MSRQSSVQNDDKLQHERELELIDKVLKGDDNAFAILMLRYQNRLLQFLYRKYGDNGLVEDVAQNVFILAYKHLSTFQGKSKFFTWLCTIGIRQMINELHARARRPSFTYEADMSGEMNLVTYADLQENQSHSVEDLILGQEKMDYINFLISQIPEKLLTPLYLSAEKGYSYQEIADKLKISVDSVRSRINRARSEFKRILAENNIEL